MPFSQCMGDPPLQRIGILQFPDKVDCLCFLMARNFFLIALLVIFRKNLILDLYIRFCPIFMYRETYLQKFTFSLFDVFEKELYGIWFSQG